MNIFVFALCLVLTFVLGLLLGWLSKPIQLTLRLQTITPDWVVEDVEDDEDDEFEDEEAPEDEEEYDA